VLAATFAMSVSYMDRQVLAVIGSSIEHALGLSHAQFGLLAGAFSIAYMGAPLAGVMVDRIGARAGLVGAVLVWSAVAAGHALAPSFGVLLTLRIALGAAESPSFPAASQTVRRVLTRRDRSAGFGILFSGSSLGAVVAAPLARGLDQRFGYRSAFVVTAVLGLAWIPLWLWATRGRAAREALAKPSQDAEDVPAAPVPRELAILERPRFILFEPAVLRATLLVLACAPAYMFVLIWYPQYMESAFPAVKRALAAHLAFPPIAFDAGAILFGAVASRRDGARLLSPAPERPGGAPVRSHPDLVAVAALMCSALCLIPLVHAPFESTLLACVSSAGVGALYTRLTAEMLARVAPTRVSTAGGVTAAAQSLVYVAVNPLVGKLYDTVHSYSAALVALGLVAIPGALLWIAWGAVLESRATLAR
jgi:MFS transporter, ACS family, aldohexuronate transporter